MIKLYHGDCLDVMKDKIKDNSIDTIITDPPYGLLFMGKKWDYDVPKIEIFKEMLRVLKPGGTMLCFAGSRTQHRMAVNIEDSGFILKDCIMFLYGSGFPKATDISKQIDKKAGAERERKKRFVGNIKGNAWHAKPNNKRVWEMVQTNNAITENAKLWNGWKSHGLKPAYEPIIVAMKPNEGSYANNALKHGVSGLNIDGGRIGIDIKNEDNLRLNAKNHKWNKNENNVYSDLSAKNKNRPIQDMGLHNTKGRYPANIILDEVAAEMLDRQSGVLVSGSFKEGQKTKESENNCMSGKNYARTHKARESTSGGASRFFYTAKASKYERNEGCEGFELKVKDENYRKPTGNKMVDRIHGCGEKLKNHHPTVKPESLMIYLCELTKTPTGGCVLDPFMGSGTTGIACKTTKRPFIGIEMDEEYFKIAEARLKKPVLPKLF